MIKNYLPDYYNNSEFIFYLSEGLKSEKEILEKFWNDTKREYFIKTTVNNIYDWEREFLVPSYLDQNLQTRRGNVLGRLRGYGTANKNFIKKVIEGFYENEEIELVEDFEKSSFTIFFKTLKGLPENYMELERTLGELIPCHLKFEYNFTFALNNYQHKELEPFKYRVLKGAIHGGK